MFQTPCHCSIIIRPAARDGTSIQIHTASDGLSQGQLSSKVRPQGGKSNTKIKSKKPPDIFLDAVDIAKECTCDSFFWIPKKPAKWPATGFSPNPKRPRLLVFSVPTINHTLDLPGPPGPLVFVHTDGGSTVVAPGPPLDGFCADCLALCT